MARAKRTHRAEARRRYRNEQASAAVADDAMPDEPAAVPRSRPTSTATTQTPSGRPSVRDAFRAAFRPLDIRADLRALPQLVRHRALWIPVILTLASAALYIAVRPGTGPEVMLLGFIPLSTFAVFFYQYFVVTPAIGGVFIAGFMAPRASWLYGILVGLVAAACYSFLVLRGFISVAPNAATVDLARDVVLASFLLSPLVGAFFASTAAWYRRFLYLSNPNRGRPRGAPPRPDGKSRSAQKAGARR